MISVVIWGTLCYNYNGEPLAGKLMAWWGAVQEIQGLGFGDFGVRGLGVWGCGV